MDQEAKTRIEQTFRSNIARVRSLLEVYTQLSAGPGRPSTQQVDVLRSGVVLLHASLEDVLRSSSEHLLPLQSAEVLNEVGFPVGPDKTKSKFTLGELHPYKGLSVNDLIRTAVTTRLQRSNYNNVGEVSAALERIGLPANLLDPHQGTLESIMKRRHLIVHRADKSPLPQRGRGIHLTQHLPKLTVETWLNVVTDVGTRIVAALPTQ